MKEYTIIFKVSESDYSVIEKEAYENGMSVAQYAKSKLNLEDDHYSSAFKSLLDNLKGLPCDRTFTVKSLFVDYQWGDLPRGVKLALGKQFYKMVERGRFRDVEIKGPDASNTMRYKKIEISDK